MCMNLEAGQVGVVLFGSDRLVKEGETVPVNSVVATIGAAGDKTSEAPEVQGVPEVPKVPGVQTNGKQSAQADGTPGATIASPAAPSTPNQAERSPAAFAERSSGREGGPQAQQLSGAELRQKSSPPQSLRAPVHCRPLQRPPGHAAAGAARPQPQRLRQPVAADHGSKAAGAEGQLPPARAGST